MKYEQDERNCVRGDIVKKNTKKWHEFKYVENIAEKHISYIT